MILYPVIQVCVRAEGVDLMYPPQSGHQMIYVIMQWSWTVVARKEGTKNAAAHWKTQLGLGGIQASLFAIDAGRILITCDKAREVRNIISFILDDAGGADMVDFIDYNHKQYFPVGRSSPLLSSDERMALEAKEGFRLAESASLGKRSNEEL